MSEAERLTKNEHNCEIFGTIFQLRTLSSNIPVAGMGLSTNCNPPINVRTSSLEETHHVVQNQAIPVVRFDIRRPILLMREEQERKSLLRASPFRI